MLLDYGYRSKCCLAPIRIGKKKIPKTQEIINVWICCRCKTKDVSILPYGEVKDQIQSKTDTDSKIGSG